MNKSEVPTVQMRWFLPCMLIIAALAVWGDIASQAMHGGSPSVSPNPPPGTYILTGHVSLQNGGGPAANAQVEMYGAQNGTTTTDATGTFHFTYNQPLCGAGSSCVSFRATMADPSCEPTHVRLDTNQFNVFCACGPSGGTGFAAELVMGSCNSTPPPPAPVEDDKKVVPYRRGLRQPNDSRFAAPIPASALQRTRLRSSGPIKLKVKVTRAVSDEVNQDGTLKDLPALVSNGVVKPAVDLSILAYDVDYAAGERDRILFNGVDIGPGGSPAYLQGSDKKWHITKIGIPTSLVRFPVHNLGGEPVPAENEIEIRIDNTNTTGRDRWATSVGAAQFLIDALYPVVMVHGNNSCGDFFAGDWLCNGNRIPDNEWFIKPFVDKKIPFDYSINMPTQTIAKHAEWLLKGNPAAGMRSLPDIAKEWGAKHVHVIAHSKGGLDMREFLTLIPTNSAPGEFAVLTLTTLSSPHLGSVGADYQVHAETLSRKEILASGSLNGDVLIRAAIAQHLGTDDGTLDLRVSAVRKFNDRNGPMLPTYFTVDGEKTKIAYIRFGADANLDNSTVNGRFPSIELSNANGQDETRGLPVVELPNWLPNSLLNASREYVYNDVYRLMWGVQETTLKTHILFGTNKTFQILREVPFSDGFGRVNDFAVTQESALNHQVFTRFLPYTTFSTSKDSHATLSSRQIADQVITQILSSQGGN